MANFRVVLTDQVFPDTNIERELIEAAGGTLDVVVGDHEAVIQAASDADAILTTYFPLPREDIEKLQGCRIIARYGIGVDNVDVAAARRCGIAVTNVPDYCVEEVATHALALALSLLRRIPEGHSEVVAGRWSVEPLRPMRRPSETTLGLVGYGRIARRVAAGAAALGMRVVVHDPYLQDAPAGVDILELSAILRESDVISLHCPLTEETRGLIGAKQLGLMKPHAVLVNTSRGPLVRLEDLLDALRLGRIGGAGLDVTDPEPPDPALLVGIDHLLVTPHVAYYSEAALRESQRKAATQVVKAMAGEPLDYLVVPAG